MIGPSHVLLLNAVWSGSNIMARSFVFQFVPALYIVEISILSQAMSDSFAYDVCKTRRRENNEMKTQVKMVHAAGQHYEAGKGNKYSSERVYNLKCVSKIPLG